MLPYSAILYSNSETEWKKEFPLEPPEEKRGRWSLSLSSALEIFLSANLLHVLIVLLGGVILPEGGLGMDMHPYHPGGGKKKHFHSSIGAYCYVVYSAKIMVLISNFFPVIISKHS